MNIDLFGHVAEAQKKRAELRDQIESVAERKAILCAELNSLVKKCPQSVANGSVQVTRNWLECRESAARVLNRVDSSIAKLQKSIAMMRAFK